MNITQNEHLKNQKASLKWRTAAKKLKVLLRDTSNSLRLLRIVKETKENKKNNNVASEEKS